MQYEQRLMELERALQLSTLNVLSAEADLLLAKNAQADLQRQWYRASRDALRAERLLSDSSTPLPAV